MACPRVGDGAERNVEAEDSGSVGMAGAMGTASAEGREGEGEEDDVAARTRATCCEKALRPRGRRHGGCAHSACVAVISLAPDAGANASGLGEGPDGAKTGASARSAHSALAPPLLAATPVLPRAAIARAAAFAARFLARLAAFALAGVGAASAAPGGAASDDPSCSSSGAEAAPAASDETAAGEPSSTLGSPASVAGPGSESTAGCFSKASSSIWTG